MVGGGNDGDGATEGGHWEMSRGAPGGERRGGVAIGGWALLAFWAGVVVF